MRIMKIKRKKMFCILLYIFLVFVLINSVYAEQVAIFNFNYDNGKTTFKDQIIKEGYYPDRNLDSGEGYKCEILDKEGNILYSFSFELPIKVYTDIINDKKVNGNVIVLNETDFSFVVPYFSNSDDLVCYNPGGYEIMREDFEKIILSPSKNKIWFWILMALACLVFVLITISYIKRSRQGIA